MREPSPESVLARWADEALPTTLDLRHEIEALDKQIKSLDFQKSHATSIGRRNSLLRALNALTARRNALVVRYKQTTGRV